MKSCHLQRCGWTLRMSYGVKSVRKRMPYFCVWILDPPRSAAGKGWECFHWIVFSKVSTSIAVHLDGNYWWPAFWGPKGRARDKQGPGLLILAEGPWLRLVLRTARSNRLPFGKKIGQDCRGTFSSSYSLSRASLRTPGSWHLPQGSLYLPWSWGLGRWQERLCKCF